MQSSSSIPSKLTFACASLLQFFRSSFPLRAKKKARSVFSKRRKSGRRKGEATLQTQRGKREVEHGREEKRREEEEE
jgi:hypothetical protein